LKAIKEKAEKIKMEIAMMQIVPRLRNQFPLIFWKVRIRK